jgi:hypothetical protein
MKASVKKKTNSQIKTSLPISPKSYDPLLAIAMANVGFSHAQIAEHFKVDRTTITKGLGQLKEWLDSANIYSQLEPQILASLRQKIISSITVDQLQNATINTKIWAIAVLFDKSQKLPRLEQHKVLGNQIKELKQLKVEQKQLIDSLREYGSRLGIDDDIIDIPPVDVKRIEQTTMKQVKVEVDRHRISEKAIQEYDILMENLPSGAEH